MSHIAVLISAAFTICYGMSASSQEESIQLNQNKNQGDKYVSELASYGSVINLLPLKILLEYKLKTESDGQRALSEHQFHLNEKLQSKFNEENLKSGPAISTSTNPPSGFCSENKLLKNLSLLEISGISNNNTNIKENLLTKEQLQGIYDSIKDCFYVKVANAKLWGPLWHCLNRLFLFFVFN